MSAFINGMSPFGTKRCHHHAAGLLKGGSFITRLLKNRSTLYFYRTNNAGSANNLAAPGPVH